MKNYSINRSLIAILILLTSLKGYGQIFNNQEAARIFQGAELLKINEKRHTIDYVKLNSNVRISEPENLSWLRTKVLKSEPEISFKLLKKETDLNGYTHYRYKQLYKSISVEYGVYYTHSKKGYIESANGEYYKPTAISTVPLLSKGLAFAKALLAVPSKKYKDDNQDGLQQMEREGELLILPVESSYLLAYKFDIYSIEPLKRVYIYVDANSGKIIKEVNRIQHADAHGTAVTAYNGNVTITTDSLSPTSFRLQASKGFGGIRTLNLNNGSNYATATNFSDADNHWNATNLDKYAYDAHFGSEATYDWYFTRFGRNSYDNAGAQINSYIHYSSGYVNAFWDGTQMTYGDGDGVTYNPLTSLDVVGHEITHAVTEHTAGLVYSNESGALNESFSDCFGVTIDYFKNPLTANFLEGDQISLTGTPFRNMGNPNQFQNPDTYGGQYWNSPNEVHNNSGVHNFWYYLVCMGGTGTNDIGNAYTVNAIGMNDASAIAYRSLSVYLSPNSTYSDARFYSIQAAVDLFGSCSNQVIQVTNAWYAVGVGALFSNAVVAGFNASQNFFCVVPATVNFSNTSLNATSYLWNFGDGLTSAIASPSHTYANAGIYTVRLIANGLASCSSSDTLILTNYITVTNGGGPISSNCTPNTVSNCCGIGITNVLFGTINHPSAIASEGYKDFTCGNSTTLTAGDPVPITITTGTTNYENVKVWIDYNNDGSFNNSTEFVFTSLNKLTNHNGFVNTSISSVLNAPLRMRVIDDNTNNTITGSCYNPQNGQAEDYTVTFIANTLPPVADFVANPTTINVGGAINFTDLTQHAPTSWLWTFPGGTPATSTLQNPVVTYNTLGTYNATLKATNSFGQNTITKVAYINVVNSINMCTGVTTTVAPNGQLYDSGGPTGSYQDGENCTLLIDPGCALSITLAFTQFSSESGYDYLRVYNGVNASAPLLVSGTGSSLPAAVTASSGKMFISWHSDGSITSSGFQASWSSVIGTGVPPVAAFTSNTSNPPLASPVQFTDATTNLPNSWSWNFGDAQSSALQNPTHSYSTPGTYTVTLIANNCISSDTVTHTITVQSAPVISVSPASLSVSLSCNDSITVPLTIYNTGGGTLITDMGGSINSSASDTTILVIQESNAWNLNMSAFLQTNYGITPTVITAAQIAAEDFSLYDVIITVGAQSTAYYATISSNVAKFEQFVNAGGIVQYQLASFSGASPINIVGGGVMTNGNGQAQNIGLDMTHPIFTGVSNPLNGNNANHCYLSTLPAGATILTETSTLSLPTTVEYEYGSGMVIATGMTWEYLYYNAYNSGPMLPNSLDYVFSKMSNTPDWISVSPSGLDTVSPGNSTVAYVTFYSNGLPGGVYTSHVLINSNDPLHPVDSIPVSLNVSFNPCANFVFDVPSACSGIVQFQDTSLNAITSWLWHFGDATSSTIQNPVHSYTAAGTYQVELVACNGASCDSITLPVTISSVNGPLNASCTPQTTAYCCSMGITNVVFGTINHASAVASEGYMDYSCSNFTNLISGSSYSIAITTGPTYSENVRAWIDFDNNGVFNTATEQVFSSNNLIGTHNGNIIIPANTLLNIPLRMRIGDDYYTELIPSPCTDLHYGQFEDYTVVIHSTTLPPNSNFSSSVLNSCTGVVQFTDLSINTPTSWLWTFGDGNIATTQNPQHQYASAGTYNVTQYVTNSYGADSSTYSVTVTVIAASFTVTGVLLTGQNLQFNTTALGTNTYQWDFGDMNFSNAQSPQHTYQLPGTFYVSVIVNNGTCAITLYDTLIISFPVNVNSYEDGNTFIVFPNPFKDELQVSYQLTKANKVSLKVINSLGQTVHLFESDALQQPGKYTYKFSNASAGIYYVYFTLNDSTKVHKVVNIH